MFETLHRNVLTTEQAASEGAGVDPAHGFMQAPSLIGQAANAGEGHLLRLHRIKPGEDCMWGDAECPLTRVFVDDMERIGTVLPAARAVGVPWLFVHGFADDVVPVQDSRDLHEVAGGTKRFETIDGADHGFTGAATPLMTQAVVTWMEQDDPAGNGASLPA